MPSIAISSSEALPLETLVEERAASRKSKAAWAEIRRKQRMANACWPCRGSRSFKHSLEPI